MVVEYSAANEENDRILVVLPLIEISFTYIMYVINFARFKIHKHFVDSISIYDAAIPLAVGTGTEPPDTHHRRRGRALHSKGRIC